MNVCVCVWARARVHMCVGPRERERERERLAPVGVERERNCDHPTGRPVNKHHTAILYRVPFILPARLVSEEPIPTEELSEEPIATEELSEEPIAIQEPSASNTHTSSRGAREPSAFLCTFQTDTSNLIEGRGNWSPLHGN